MLNSDAVKPATEIDCCAVVMKTQFRVKSGSAGALSDFSSYGPAVDLSFKPDISAPGSLIVRC